MVIETAAVQGSVSTESLKRCRNSNFCEACNVTANYVRTGGFNPNLTTPETASPGIPWVLLSRTTNV
jgi:hypothetical protein